jgi:hypothetical protein
MIKGFDFTKVDKMTTAVNACRVCRESLVLDITVKKDRLLLGIM